ncbi:hypothetical protein [Nonomuraea sp. NPDC050783]|uniref:hypothetical protein n=1 Tax=Nonomuraea sp. NPDC050783 TaxID=3154634 RepID=UPI003466E78A
MMIVEGEADFLALKDHVDEADVNIVPGNGKAIVVPAITLLNNDSVPDVIALVDRDLEDHAGNPSPSYGNLFFTDRHDLDATIFYTGSICDRIAYSFGGRSGIDGFLANGSCKTVAEAATLLALPLGALRLISVRDGYDLPLKKFPLGEVTKGKSTIIDVNKMAQIAIQRCSGAVTIAPSDLAGKVLNELTRISDGMPFCSGHDLVRALTIILRVHASYSVAADVLEKTLRAAFGCTELASCVFFSQINVWRRENSRKIWRCATLAA